jgi:glycosyltransferase involved in cell wall biosynthesis
VRVAHVNDIAFVGSTMVRALRERGIDARLVDPARPGARTRYPRKLATRPLRVAALAAAGLELRRGSFDLVHVHFARLGFLGPMSGRPYVLECHGTDIRGVRPGSAWGREVAPFLRHAAAVLYATPDLQPWVEAFRPDAGFLPNPTEPPSPGLLEVDPDRDVLVGVRLDEVKGAERIAELLRGLTAARPSTTVTLVDHGPSVRAVAAAAGSHVEVVPPLAHAAMPALLRRHRVALGQQRLGILGNYELEALAMGVPVATGYRRWEAYETAPPLVDQGTGPDAVARIVRLLGDEAERAVVAREGVEWVRRHHDPGVVAARLAQVYAAVLAGRRRPG